MSTEKDFRSSLFHALLRFPGDVTDTEIAIIASSWCGLRFHDDVAVEAAGRMVGRIREGFCDGSLSVFAPDDLHQYLANMAARCVTQEESVSLALTFEVDPQRVPWRLDGDTFDALASQTTLGGLWVLGSELCCRLGVDPTVREETPEH